jgi:hypothetical protein
MKTLLPFLPVGDQVSPLGTTHIRVFYRLYTLDFALFSFHPEILPLTQICAQFLLLQQPVTEGP